MLKERLREFRKAKGWTQDDLAERSGYSRSSIINWESGKRAPRTVDIEKLAMVLGVSPRDLIDDTLEFLNDENHVKLQISSQEQHNATKTGYGYWGDVLDRAQKLASNKNLQEISLILPLMKLAYDTLASAQNSLMSTPLPVKTDSAVVAHMSISGGHHNKNTQNIH